MPEAFLKIRKEGEALNLKTSLMFGIKHNEKYRSSFVYE